MRIVKNHSLISLANGFIIDAPTPSNISYLWNFGSLLGLCLVIQIVTGVTLAMHYNPSVLEAFNSVEHIMRDVNNGWLIRYLHSNTASAFFFLVYLHIGRGLYYGSYQAPRTLTWTIGTVIFIVMMATAFLGYVLPYGQMSLWGLLIKPQMHNLFIYLLTYIFLFTFILSLSSVKIKNKTLSSIPPKIIRVKGKYRIGPHDKDLLCIIFGSLLGDAHGEKREDNGGTRIAFYQESSHIEYMLYLHNILHNLGYCSSGSPAIGTRLGSGGKVRKTVRFATWTYTSFNWIHELWYANGIKRVPDCIDLYLTPLALAIWIMDDGAKVGKGLKFSTNSYSYGDCLKLVNALANNFNIKSTIQSAGVKDQHIIYIWKESMDNLRNIVSPYMIKEMRYKID